jgi:L-arabinokinase
VFICFYISGHGFGHAAREVEIINALLRRDRTMRVAVRTDVPQWFLDASLIAPVERIDGAPVDTGVVQPDSLSVDEAATAREAGCFYATFPARVAGEAALIARLAIDLVVGDMPPLAFAAAAAAQVPSVAVGNFTWDWIYGGYPQFEAMAPGVCDTITAADARATLALRLPFAGGFAQMEPVEEVPLVARHASRRGGDTRQRLDLVTERPLVLASFGGHGNAVPLERAAARGTFTVVATDYEVSADRSDDTLRVFSPAALRAADVTYTDLLAACDAVVTKLGYGIVSECLANDVPLLYTTRGRFREQEVFVRQMPAVMRCAPIAREPLLAGDWKPSLDSLLSQSRPGGRPPSNGADIVADRVLALVR